jgi:hypothetical protein
MSAQDYLSAIIVELERLGLSIEDWPYDAMATSGSDPLAPLAEWLDHLRTLQPGVTWHEADPELPTHWVPGEPDTWTTPYCPFGPYDYQQLPTGPAVHVSWKQAGSAEALAVLVEDARGAGFAVYGAGPIDEVNTRGTEYDAFVILEAGTSDDALGRFIEWLEERTAPILAAVPRTGFETYLE